MIDKCSHCGAPLQPDQKFCKKCGTPIKRNSTSSPKNDFMKVNRHSAENNKGSRQDKESKRKGILVWSIVAILAFMIIGGIANKKGDQTYKYKDLGESQKSEIDFILSKSSFWESEKCDTVGFTKSDGKKLLSVFYLDDMWQENYYEGTRVWYQYNLATGSFSQYDSRYEYHSLKIYNTENGRLSHTKEWSEEWSIEKKKDYLANELIRQLISK